MDLMEIPVMRLSKSRPGLRISPGMSRFVFGLFVSLVMGLPLVPRAADTDDLEKARIVQTATLAAPEANQAAAADERFVYAIDSTLVAKYDRTTKERIAISTGEAKHLNSGFFWRGKLYWPDRN
jgi:hypothetical protein